MDAKLMAEAEDLHRTALRLERAGLVIDRTTLSPTHRRALFALQRRLASASATAAPEAPRAVIGFAYPNPR